VRAGRRGEGDRPHPRAGRPDADVHHAQGREEAVGPRAGGRVPGHPVGEAVGRHDRPPRCRLPLHRSAAHARPAAERARPVRRLAPRRLRRLCRIPLRLGV
ncbi:MAG: L-fucose kinase, partial [uncultured Chloroflexi bacterium]